MGYGVARKYWPAPLELFWMAKMSVDIYNTRRGYFNKCKWYARDEDTGESNEIIISRPANGIFYAKEIAAQTSQDKGYQWDVSFIRPRYNYNESQDLTGIKRGCLVEYNWKNMALNPLMFKKALKKQRIYTKRVSTWYFFS